MGVTPPVVAVVRGKLPGDGYGYGNGYGDGYGYGNGNGYGDGYGYGYGDGYWLSTIPSVVCTWPRSQQDRYRAAAAGGATFAFWKSNADGTPANGGRGGTRKAGDVETIPGPLQLCGSGALHATDDPQKWQGKRVWIVALFGEIARDESDDKLGALHREILGEAWVNPD